MNDRGERREPSGERPEPGGIAAPLPGVRTVALDAPPAASPNRRAWQRLRKNRPALVSGFFLAVVTVLALIWPWFGQPRLAPHLPSGMTWSPTTLSAAQFQPPAAGHWFGTDVHGRDLLSRVFYGARISL